VAKTFSAPAIFLVAGAVVFAASCASSGGGPRAEGGEEISFVADVKWISLEGGFFGLVADEGVNYLPLNLPEGFRKDGLKVKVRGRVREGFTIYMWGLPFEIDAIEINRP